VFCYRPRSTIDLNNDKLDNCSTVKRYKPRPIDRRILAQDGVFTFHPNPEQPLRAKLYRRGAIDLVVIRVPAKNKRTIQRRLRDIGMHRWALFPDYDGLSESINWTTRREAGRK
jgi:hypothetical protein